MSLAALCLDATGTMIETARSVGEEYREAALDRGVELPAWRLDDAFRRVLRHAPPRGTRGQTVAEREAEEIAWWHEIVRQTFQATDSTVRFEDFPAFAVALFDRYRHGECWRLRPGVRPTLTRLREAGWPMAVASNFDHRLRKILEDLEIIHFFDLILVPSRIGYRKPERSYFEALARGLGVDLGKLGYVGDDASEVLTAISALGIRVYDVRDLGELDRLPDRLGMPATLMPAADDRSARGSTHNE